MSIDLVVSGGQTGADQSGWRAARASGIATGGWMPRGFKTEDGPRPEFADLYGAREHRSASYRDRTIVNVTLAAGTLCFVHDQKSPGSRLARDVAEEVRRPFLFIVNGVTPGPEWLVSCWFARLKPASVNIAGNRESSAPGIGAWVERYLSDVFRLLKEQQP